MAERMTSRLRERIETQLDQSGRTAASVSRAAGYGPDFIRDFLTGRKKSLNSDALARIARELGVTIAWLQGEGDVPEAPAMSAFGPPRTIPVFGTAAGSSEGALNVTQEVIEWLPCPVGLEGARDAYALYVNGESMVPRFRHGDIIFVAPHRPVRAGDDVVLQVRHNDDPSTESWIKEYVKEAEGRLVTRQYNPPRELTFNRREVVEMHRVLTPNELLGL